nr:hypothetical protein [Acidocella aquatica]
MRLPTDLGLILRRTHLIASLGTSDAHNAKINASRLFFSLACFLETLRLRMTHELNTDRTDQSPAELLALGAFELGRQYQMGVEELRIEFNLKLKAMVTSVQAQMVPGDTAVWEMASAPQPAPMLTRQVDHPHYTQMTNETVSVEMPPSIISTHTVEEARPRNLIPSSPVWHTLRTAFMRDKPDLEKKTIWSYDQAFDIWIKLIGDKAIRDIRRGDVKVFADFLRDKENPRGGKLSHATIQRSVGHIKTFMSWAVAAGSVEDDGFEKVSIRSLTKEERMGDEDRRAFTQSEVSMLFHSRLFTEECSPSEEATRWFLAIAALTGARTEEIAMAPSQFVWVDDVLCMDLRKVGTKTPAAPRLIPLLGDLLKMGIVEWAAKQSARGFTLVQPDVKQKSAPAWSKFLNRYLDKTVTKDPTLALYSLRHSFRQMLRAGNIGDELCDKIFGHSSGKVGAGYGRDLSADEARLFLAGVKPHVSLQHLWQ